jgi:hypothetical protein
MFDEFLINAVLHDLAVLHIDNLIGCARHEQTVSVMNVVCPCAGRSNTLSTSASLMVLRLG